TGEDRERYGMHRHGRMDGIRGMPSSRDYAILNGSSMWGPGALAALSGRMSILTPKAAKTDQPTTASAAGTNFLQAFAETRGFRLGYPTAVRPTPDEGAVLFLRSEARNPETRLYEL